MEAKLKGNLIDHEKYLQSTYLIWVRYPKWIKNSYNSIADK
jgi:hypothetical protein